MRTDPHRPGHGHGHVHDRGLRGFVHYLGLLPAMWHTEVSSEVVRAGISGLRSATGIKFVRSEHPMAFEYRQDHNCASCYLVDDSVAPQEHLSNRLALELGDDSS